MKLPHQSFDDLVAVSAGDPGVDGAVCRATDGAGRPGEQLTAAFVIVDVLERIAADHAAGVVELPIADVERFAPDLVCPETPPPGAADRLVRFEVERVHGMLDAAYTVVGPLRFVDRVRVSWAVGGARARLQALARRPDPFHGDRPRPWRVSHALAAFRTLRRSHHRRMAPHFGGQ